MRRTRCIQQTKVGNENTVLQMRVVEEQEQEQEQVQEITVKKAREGCVVVRMTLRPVQPTDMFLIRSGHPQPALNHPFPRVVGCEGFGLVHQVGEGVTQFQCGQRVVPLVWLEYGKHGQGSWQDYVELEAEQVIAVPATVSDEAAAQFFLNPWTAYGLLDDQAVPKEEYLLQTAASSILGRQLIQIAKHLGIKTINIVRRDVWKEKLKALGADEVINSETEDVVERVKAITGGKLAYAAVDAVAGSLTKVVAATVRDNGKVLVYGLLSGDWDMRVSLTDLMRGVQVNWWWMLPNYIPTLAKRLAVATQVMKLLEQHIVTFPICKRFPLEDYLVAIAESEKPGFDGKILLVS